MKKRKSRNRTKHLYKEQDKSWKTALFFALFTLAFIAFFASRQRYLMGQTLGCTTPYDVCPTSTSTPVPSAGGGGGGGGGVITTTTVAPNTTTTTLAPNTTTTIVPSQGTVNTTPGTSNTSPFIPPPPPEEPNNSSPGVGDTPAISNPSRVDTLRSFIADPGSSTVVQSLIVAPASVLYGNIMDTINSQLSSLVHQEGPRINRFRLPAQVCTFLGNVGMEWLCQ